MKYRNPSNRLAVVHTNGAVRVGKGTQLHSCTEWQFGDGSRTMIMQCEHRAVARKASARFLPGVEGTCGSK